MSTQLKLLRAQFKLKLRDNKCFPASKICREFLITVINHYRNNWTSEWQTVLKNPMQVLKTERDTMKCCDQEMVLTGGAYVCMVCGKTIQAVGAMNQNQDGGGPQMIMQVYRDERGNELTRKEARERYGLGTIFYDQDSGDKRIYELTNEINTHLGPEWKPLQQRVASILYDKPLGKYKKRRAMFALTSYQMSNSDLVHFANLFDVDTDFIKEQLKGYLKLGLPKLRELPKQERSTPTRDQSQKRLDIYSEYAAHSSFLESRGFPEDVSLAFIIKNVVTPKVKQPQLKIAFKQIRDHYNHADERQLNVGMRNITTFFEKNPEARADFYTL